MYNSNSFSFSDLNLKTQMVLNVSDLFLKYLKQLTAVVSSSLFYFDDETFFCCRTLSFYTSQFYPFFKCFDSPISQIIYFKGKHKNKHSNRKGEKYIDKKFCSLQQPFSFNISSLSTKFYFLKINLQRFHVLCKICFISIFLSQTKFSK
ncbi:hypothetical protein RFI_35733 [Reticulomyxa filosa]|uniref:Uncharacterized protein n=1 Tax=Reticulomyxa filosa TaxID=46433 RepID=X6LK04_RETFI|nr:hypothetical protein RFI_35733 [Reticulomyxa filosa]|eukprot:ETO01706.1 hypothetical protein RFI_35733 [Reticulomyxa filosa]